jgi:hypothetical protein
VATISKSRIVVMDGRLRAQDADGVVLHLPEPVRHG